MKPSIVIITGLSGSGKTVALRALEDGGFFCVDNIPPELIDTFASVIIEKGGHERIAVGIDIREKAFLPMMDSVMNDLKKKYLVETIFLDAEKDVLMRRFKETRRPHPLSAHAGDLEESIVLEKEMLGPLRGGADRVLDTSAMNPHQLRRTMTSLYAGGGPGSMNITLISFGFKYGIPQGSDLLFDVRFVRNPHFVPELKKLSGLDEPVINFVMDSAETADFLEILGKFLDFLIPLYLKEGKAYLTIGIGCTGGRHRSPVIAEETAKTLKGHPVNVEIIHRDI